MIELIKKSNALFINYLTEVKMKKVFKAAIVVILVIFGCKDSIVENEELARISFQDGTIEGIKTDDDTTTVLKKLGKPAWVGLGDFDGFQFLYENKNQPGIEILIVTFFNRIYGLTPPDFRVTGVTVLNSYDGKSKEGLGIRTSRSEVISKLGNPVLIYDYGEFYYFARTDKKNNVVSFSYDENQKVKSISIDTRTN